MGLTRSLGLEAYNQNDRHRELVHRMIAGLNALPIHYSIRMQHFLRHYLGTANDPVPFGGREEALFALDDWRTDPSAPPYALLVAEAGRGKSALLVCWLDLLLASDDVHVIFVPISIGFDENLSDVNFIMLAAALGEVYGEPIESKDLSAQQWRNVCKSYLRRAPPSGKPLLVILDGLDDAADFTLGRDFFPSPPPSNVRVLVSARYLAGDVDEQGWRQRLGWESERVAYTQPLPPLTLDGVQDVLREMAIEPQWVTDVKVIDELYRLSEGDPLLVRLYVEALFKGEPAALMSVQQLQAMPPSLARYLEGWWAQQNTQSELRGITHARREVKELFNLSAAALGPLTEQDITEIAGEALTSFLQHSRREVERFIMGDGKQQGYTFSHPRLGYYFWEQMSQAEQESWNKRFCDVGRRTLDALSEGTLHPANASPYIIQYYGAHLERTDAPPAAFYALVSQGWMGAWEALEGHVGFLNDVERAWQRAEDERDITMQIKCALCRASVAALRANIPPELLVLALEQDALTPTQALVMAKNNQYHYNGNDNTLAKLIPLLPLELLPEALAAARLIQSKWLRDSTLLQLARQLPPERLSEALTIIDQIQDETRRDCTLSLIAQQQPPERLVEALAIIDQIVPFCRRCALSHLGNQYPEHLPEILAAARRIPDEANRAYMLSILVDQQPELLSEALAIICQIRDEKPLADELLKLAREALDLVHQIQNETQRIYALRPLAGQLPEGLISEALDLVRQIQDEHSRAEILSVLANQLPRELLPKALNLAGQIKGKSNNARVQSALTKRFTKQLVQLSQEGLRDPHHIKRIRYEKEHARTLSNLVSRLQKKHLPTAIVGPHKSESERNHVRRLPKKLLPEALNLARQIQYESSRAGALSALAHQFPEILPELFVALQQIGDPEVHLNILSRHVSTLPNELWPEALNLAYQMEDGHWREDFLSLLAPYMPDELLPQALILVGQTEDKEGQRRLLLKFAKHRLGILPELLATARQIQDQFERSQVLSALAPYIPGLGHLLVERLDLVEQIQNEFKARKLLLDLAPQLPDQLLQKALTIVGRFRTPYSRADALSVLAPLFSDEQVLEALAIVRQIQQEQPRARALSGLAPKLTHEHLPEALAIARQIQQEEPRATALSALAPQLTDEHLPEALAIAHQIQQEEPRARALSSLVPYLSAQSLPEIIAVAGKIQNEWSRTELLFALAPLLPKKYVRKVLILTHQIRNEKSRTKLLSALAGQQIQLLPEALSPIRQIKDEEARAKALLDLASQHSELVREAFAAARHIQDKWSLGGRNRRDKSRIDYQFVEALKSLAPQQQPEPLLLEALGLTCQIRNERDRIEAFSALANYLSPALLGEALNIIGQIQDERWRVNVLSDTLSVLVPQLSRWPQTEPDMAYIGWKQMIRTLSVRTRPAFLKDLSVVIPFMLALAGEDRESVALGVSQVMQEVSEWWP